MIRVLVIASVALLGCGDKDKKADTKKPSAQTPKPQPQPPAAKPKPDPKPQPKADPPSGSALDPDMVPRPAKALFAWLQSKSYSSWTAEPKLHPGRGPHPKRKSPVRVFMNSVLVSSLKAKGKEHPDASAAVKEMYQNGKLWGWAVMIKTAPKSNDGKNWYWYEVKSTTDGSKTVAKANGVELCVDCHDSGNDMVLTKYPFKK